MSAGTPPGSLRHGLMTSLAAAGTTWLAMFSWRGFGESPVRYLGPLLVAGAIVAGVGALLRWWRVPGPVVLLVQLIAAGGYVSRTLSGSVLPTGEHRVELVDRWQAAVEAAQGYASPVPAEVATLEPLLLPLGVVCLLLVDVVACTLRRVPLAGLATAHHLRVGVSVLAGAVPWPWFALPAAGFLVMLFLFEDEYVARWGRGVGGRDDDESDGFGVRTGAVRATAIGVGGAATALAVVLPTLIPTLQLGVFGGGIGGSGGSVDIENPIVDLRRDLRRGDDVALIRMETDDPAPAYLRISVLTRFNSSEWTSGDRDIPADQRADGTLPPQPGVTGGAAGTEYTYEVSALDSFRSTWLPAMASATYLDARGNWRFDRDTMDFLAADDDHRHQRSRLHDAGRRPRPERGRAGRRPGSCGRGGRPLHRAAALGAPGGTRASGGHRGRGRQQLREGGRPAELVPARRRLRVQPRAGARGQRQRRAGGLPRRADRLLRAVRVGDGGDGAVPRHPGAGGGGLPHPGPGVGRRATSTPPTTCTPGPSSTSPARAGCGSSRRPAPARRWCRRTPARR